MKKTPGRRKRRLRILRRALAVAVLVPVLLVLVVVLFPGPLFRWLALPRIEEAAGRILGFPLRIEKADLELGGKLTLGGIEARGPAPRTGIHGISVGRAEVAFSLRRLLAGEPDWIEEVRVESPEVVLDLRHDPFLPPGGGAEPAEASSAPHLPRIVISGAGFHIRNGPEALVLRGLDASLRGRSVSLDIESGSGDWSPPRLEAIEFPLRVRALLAEGPDPFRVLLVESLAFGPREIARDVEVDLSSPGEVKLSGRLPGWGVARAEAEIAGDVLDLRATVADAPIAEIVAAFTPWRCPAGRGTGDFRLILPFGMEEDWRAEADMEIDGVAWQEAGLAASRLAVRGKRGEDLVLECGVLALDLEVRGSPPLDAVARFRRAPSSAGEVIAVGELTLHRSGLSASASGVLREADLSIEDGHLSVRSGRIGALEDLVPGASGVGGVVDGDVFFEGRPGHPETYDVSAALWADEVSGLTDRGPVDASLAARLAGCGVRIDAGRVRSGSSEVSFALAAELDIPLRAAFTRLEGAIEGIPFEATLPPLVDVGPAGWRVGPAALSLLGGGAAFAVEGDAGGRMEAWAATRGISLSLLLDRFDLPGDPDGEIAGDLDFRLPGAAAAEEPRLEAEARVAGLGWTVGDRRIAGAGVRFHAVGDGRRLEVEEARVDRGEDRVVLQASVPVEWFPLPRPLSGAPLEASFEAQVAEIADLPVSFREFRDVGGRVVVEGTASMSLAGDLAGILRAARIEADLLLTGGTLKLYGDAPPTTDLVADIGLAGRDLTVRSLTGKARGSDFRVTGKAVVRPPWEEGGAGIDEVDFRLKSEGALLVRAPQLRVRGDLDVSWKGPWERAVLGGGVEISRAYYTRDISLLPGRGVSLPPRLFSISDPPFADTRFDLRVRGDRSIFISNNLVSTHATADLRLGGTGREPVISGTLSARDGWVSVGNARLDLRSALVEFLEADPLNPRLDVVCGDTIRSYAVTVAVSGTLEEPEVLIDSSPPLERERVLVLIATGLTYGEIEERGVDRVAALEAAVYMGRRIARYFSTGDPSETSFFDRVSLQSESARSSRYEDLLRVEFRAFENVLLDKDEVFLQGERDTYGDYNFNAGYRFELD